MWAASGGGGYAEMAMISSSPFDFSPVDTAINANYYERGHPGPKLSSTRGMNIVSRYTECATFLNSARAQLPASRMLCVISWNPVDLSIDLCIHPLPGHSMRVMLEMKKYLLILRKLNGLDSDLCSRLSVICI